MRVLLIGSGGREHALVWKLAQSGRLDRLYSLPGNPGLAALGPVIDHVLPTDPDGVAEAARRHLIDIVVVGPEAPLAAGVVDALTARGIAAFGPTTAAARLESSKSFAKEVMARAGVTTARAASFADRAAARRHLEETDGPFVVKADGLAAGKGVLVSEDRAEAIHWVERCFDGGFGKAGLRVVIEEYLAGPEVSVFALCAGEEGVPLEPARDYKRLLDDDRGPNTGGMGSYSPVEDLPPGLLKTAMEEVIRPVLRQMAADGHPYRGFLYAGLVLTAGGPKVLEFNCRLGDPETQVVLPRLAGDLLEVLEEILSGRMPADLAWSESAAVNVVLAAPGYPDRPAMGGSISVAEGIEGEVLVFHAGTDRTPSGELVVAGGRVLNVVGLGADRAEARERAYRAIEGVRFEGMQYRRDIGR